ncbi:hypothetical protein GCM10010348_73560 [Streptomyces anthocyanicus]|nr:hypothetical protein GCM10010348_73560 [Streptomyces anthocyanicus]
MAGPGRRARRTACLEGQAQFEDEHPVTSFLEGHGIAEESIEFRGRLEPVDRDGQDNGTEQTQK